jgi:hypothetical protein
VELSSDFASWQSGAGVTTAPAILNDNGLVQTLQVNDAAPAAGRHFVRLRVIGP